MKRLYIVRHSKSGDKESGMQDIERRLNSRGEKDAKAIGKRLKRHEVNPDVIYSSPTKRAQQTADFMTGAMDIPRSKIITEDTLYHGSFNDIFHFIKGLENSYEQVMIFGHNPDFSRLADKLAEKSFGNLPTSAVVCLDFPAEKWGDIQNNSGAVLLYEHPKK